MNVLNLMNKNGNIYNLVKKKITRRQDYPNNYFFIDGSIYLSKVSFLKKYNSFVVKNKTKLFKLSQYPSVDIDEIIDLKIAKLFL